MFAILMILVALVVLDVMAMRFGADSRDLDILNVQTSEMHAQI